MPTKSFEKALEQLDGLKKQFSAKSAAQILVVLERITRLRISDADSLLYLHELLLFVRAHPHNTAVLKQADAMLKTIPQLVLKLQKLNVDLSPLEHPESSGIAGLPVTDNFSFPIVSWLAQRTPSEVSFYWDWFEDENRIGEWWPGFMPLLEEDSLVEANIPFREWLREARGRKNEVTWLVDQFHKLGKRKAEIFNAQKLYVKWQYSYEESRTGLPGPNGKVFFHDGPLLQRRDVQFKDELNKPPLPVQELSPVDGQRAIDLARLASTVRYRELYGFTNGDPKSVYQVDLGRGVCLQLISLPPEKRLPLRAYHSAMIYKNSVPIGYFEGLSFFERMESGFNLYYTFRDGETAWLYAQILRVMKHLTGVTAFSLDPYQIGFENEEGIASGAYWFYRKLGFRSTSKPIQELTEKEETRIATRKNYRTSAATLRRLAHAPMILELDETRSGDWDNFQIRNIGFAVQRLMAQQFDGNEEQIRLKALQTITRVLGIEEQPQDSKSFSDLAIALFLVPELQRWSNDDKVLLKRIIEAKCKRDESNYLKLLQKHDRLREVFLRLGSS
ncbi:MAG TPA: hypothetical protein VI306_01375 [Pyrinomonadaceae bacterium]